MRERDDVRDMDRQQRVEQVGEPDALRLGDEPEEVAISIEGPVPAGIDNPEAVLIPPEEQLLAHGTRVVVAVDHGGAGRPVPLHADDGHGGAGHDALHHCPDGQLLKRGHTVSPAIRDDTRQGAEGAPPSP